MSAADECAPSASRPVSFAATVFVNPSDLGGLVHLLDERGLVAADVDGQRLGGVAGADDEQGAQQQGAVVLHARREADDRFVLDTSSLGIVTTLSGSPACITT